MFSRTLKTTDDWPETRLPSGDTATGIAKLKAEPSKDLFAAGGAAFLQWLIKLGAIDEYRLWVHPAITGKGAPLITAPTSGALQTFAIATERRPLGSSRRGCRCANSSELHPGNYAPYLPKIDIFCSN